jgi:tetratricopeptide (TPR) repeat protein
MKRGALLTLLFLVAAVSLATWIQPRHAAITGGRSSGSVMKLFFGESRRLFANHLAAQADVYLHGGFYPSIFDQASQQPPQNAGESAAAHDEPAGHEHGPDCNHGQDHQADEHDEHDCPDCKGCDTSFLKPPLDWFEKVGRNFKVTEHSHLEGDRSREILPWLKLSAELDPQRIETYTVGAYWLCERLGKFQEAEQFLREGQRANPTSYEILFELGRLYSTQLKQPDRARGVWKLALRLWDKVEAGKEKPDTMARGSILVHLAELENRSGNLRLSVDYFEEALKYTPAPERLKERINQLRSKMSQPAAPAQVAPH